ncbi:MAG TPA: hypothetical protein VN132_08485, partial [Bdellovibrio sp.]|nr:hypothetical protein [Bdellovibrio sp.]
MPMINQPAHLKAEFIQQLRTSFPGLKSQPLEDLVAENLLSPFVVELPAPIREQAQKIIAGLFGLREKKSYQTHYLELAAMKGLKDPGNKSIMMSYDFHLDEQQNLKLIEINTNASFLALGYEMYKTKNLPVPVADFTFDEVRQDIFTELRLQGRSPHKLKIAITDDNPSAQRLFVEFLVYNELFQSWGWDSRIIDYRELFKEFHPEFVYNRHTDFFLSQEDSRILREKFLNREICLSPNPYEYLLLADKQRLIDWSQEGFFEAHGLSDDEISLLRQAVPRSYDVTAVTVENVWALRKKLFFKPKNAFGSKQSYKGSSISRKALEELMKEDTIAQEYIPASEAAFETPEGMQNFKYDLRCFAYQGRLQMIVARLYQGQ